MEVKIESSLGDNLSSIVNDVIRQRRLNRYQSLNSTSDKKNTILSKDTLFNLFDKIK